MSQQEKRKKKLTLSLLEETVFLSTSGTTCGLALLSSEGIWSIDLLEEDKFDSVVDEVTGGPLAILSRVCFCISF